MRTGISLFASFLAMVMAPQATLAAACVPIPVYAGQTETVFSLGIQFDFGDMKPAVVGSVRHTETDKGNDVKGGKLDIVLPILGDQKLVPKVRVMGLMGSPDVQGEAGLGFDFATQQPLVGIGVQGPYVNGGIDLPLDGAFQPYIGLNSYGGAAERQEVAPPPP